MNLNQSPLYRPSELGDPEVKSEEGRIPEVQDLFKTQRPHPLQGEDREQLQVELIQCFA